MTPAPDDAVGAGGGRFSTATTKITLIYAFATLVYKIPILVDTIPIIGAIYTHGNRHENPHFVVPDRHVGRLHTGAEDGERSLQRLLDAKDVDGAKALQAVVRKKGGPFRPPGTSKRSRSMRAPDCRCLRKEVRRRRR